MYDDTEAASKEESLSYANRRPLPPEPSEKAGNSEDEYEFCSEENYDSISFPYANEEPKAPAEPQEPAIEAVTAQSTCIPKQWKGCWENGYTAVLLTFVGVSLLMNIILLSQHGAIFLELKRLNTICENSTEPLMTDALKSALITELRTLEKYIDEKSEATVQKVLEHISRNETNENDRQDTFIKPAPLHWKHFQGNCYYYSKNETPWESAKTSCARENSQLIVINSKEEQDFVVSKTDFSSVWLGLSDAETEGSWHWVDGSSLTQQFWRQGEPNNRGEEDCAVLSSKGNWNDIPCDKKVHFVCEKRGNCACT